jgi:hypothetical protein
MYNARDELVTAIDLLKVVATGTALYLEQQIPR